MTKTKEQTIIDEINKGIDYSNGNRTWKAIGELLEIRLNQQWAILKKVLV